MTNNMLALVMAAGLCGCAGVSITPISMKKAGDAHNAAGDVKGYVVYAPVLVVEITEKLVCLKPTKDSCDKPKLVCAAGTPFVLPDYTKPYVVEVRSGFGKAGVDIALKDGWLITNIKDSSDNTALLGFIEKMVLKESKSGVQAPETPETPEGCSITGLYQVVPSAGGIDFKRVTLYPQPKPTPPPEKPTKKAPTPQ